MDFCINKDFDIDFENNEESDVANIKSLLFCYLFIKDYWLDIPKSDFTLCTQKRMDSSTIEEINYILKGICAKIKKEVFIEEMIVTAKQESQKLVLDIIIRLNNKVINFIQDFDRFR